MQAPATDLLRAQDNRTLPREVEDDFWRIWRTYREYYNFNDAEVCNLKKKIERHQGPFAPIPPDELAAFNRAFFFRNSLKCLVVIHWYRAVLGGKPLLDLGCGAGVASVAWLLAMKPTQQEVLCSVCVDRSLEQLSIARRNFRELIGTESLPKFLYNFREVDDLWSERITFMSFFLCEVMAEGIDPRDLRRFCSRMILAIDYEDVIHRFKDNIIEYLEFFEIFNRKYILPSNISQIIGQDTLRVVGLYATQKH